MYKLLSGYVTHNWRKKFLLFTVVKIIYNIILLIVNAGIIKCILLCVFHIEN